MTAPAPTTPAPALYGPGHTDVRMAIVVRRALRREPPVLGRRTIRRYARRIHGTPTPPRRGGGGGRPAPAPVPGAEGPTG